MNTILEAFRRAISLNDKPAIQKSGVLEADNPVFEICFQLPSAFYGTFCSITNLSSVMAAQLNDSVTVMSTLKDMQKNLELSHQTNSLDRFNELEYVFFFLPL